MTTQDARVETDSHEHPPDADLGSRTDGFGAHGDAALPGRVAIGEVWGMIIGTAVGFSDLGTIDLASPSPSCAGTVLFSAGAAVPKPKERWVPLFGREQQPRLAYRLSREASASS